MINDTIISILMSFIICIIVMPFILPVLHRLKFGQQVRDDGPNSHLQKKGTPTMGGIVILLSFIVTSLFFINKYPLILPVLLLTLGFGIIGFLDDFLKIKKKKSEGLNTKQKLALQIIFTLIFIMYIYGNKELFNLLIPFTGGLKTGYFINIGILFIPFVFFVVLGTDNGVNFTDGLDGLCTSVTIAISVFFVAVDFKENLHLSPVIGAMIGALLGFAVFNIYPAKIFMGDTGSLSLGAFVSALALMMRLPLFILIVGFIYLIEVISVIIQVTYFKKTGGRRFFKMAPIHHHFELSGLSETKIVGIFTIITIILSLIAFLGMNYR